MVSLNTKQIFNSILFIGLLLPISALQAAVKDSSDGRRIIGVKLNTDLITGSTGVSQYMLNRLALGGYMSPENIAKSDKHVGENSHAGFGFNASFNVLFDSLSRNGKSLKGLRIYRVGLQLNTIAGATFSQGAFRTVFMGNAPFLGQQLDIKARMKQYSTRGISAGWMMRKNGGMLKLGVGLEQLLAYRNLNIHDSYLRTDSNASNVYAKLNGTFYNSGQYHNGYGLVTEVSWQFKSQKKTVRLLSLGISRLGFYLAPEGNEFSKIMDTAARIQQSEIQLKLLNSSAWVTQQKDTFTRALDPDSNFIKNKLIIAPFHLSADIQIKNLQVKFYYIYINGYLPSATLTPAKPFKVSGLQVQPALQLGGFDTYNLNLRFGSLVKLNASIGMDWALQLNGIESMILSKITHGAGAGLGVKVYYLK